MVAWFEISARHVLLALFAAAPLAGAKAAELTTTQLIVAYVEAKPNTVGTVERGLKSYAATLPHGTGPSDFEILQEVGRPQRMAIIERWPESEVPADGVLQRDFDGKLQAPVDRRIHHAAGPLLTGAAAAPFHMLMHVDVVPVGSAAAAKLLDAQRVSVMAAPGARGFELATQAEKPNHFAVHETWVSRSAYESYAAGPAAQELRKQLAMVKGALFDDRFYVPISAPHASRKSR